MTTHGHTQAHHLRSVDKPHRRIPFLLWPFVMLARLISAIVLLTGRLLAVIIGLVLVITGFALSLTVVGALVGVPLAFVGVLLIVRGLF